jgi:hypothetical protein
MQKKTMSHRYSMITPPRRYGLNTALVPAVNDSLVV